MWFRNQPMTLDAIESAPYRFVNERTLNATPDEVFAILASPDAWPRWFPEFRGVRWLTPEPRGVGSEREVRLDTLKVRERFLAWAPGARFAFTMTHTSLPLTRAMAEDYQLSALPNGQCRLVWIAAYAPTLGARLIHPILRRVFGRMFDRAADGLVRYVAAGHRA